MDGKRQAGEQEGLKRGVTLARLWRVVHVCMGVYGGACSCVDAGASASREMRRPKLTRKPGLKR